MSTTRSTRARRGLIACTALAVVGLLITGPAASAAPRPKPPTVSVVPGLESLAGPFGIDVVGNRLFIAEQGAQPDESSGFPGAPGAISEWKKGKKTVLAAFDAGAGPSDLSVRNPADISYVVGVLGEDLTTGNDLGRIVAGRVQPTIDLGSNEIADNPDQVNTYGPLSDIPPDCFAQIPDSVKGQLETYTGGLDSNVYSVDTVPFTKDRFVTDAAANAVYRIRDGAIAHTWVLPPVVQTVTEEGIAAINQEQPPDAQVPTCLAGLRWAGEPVPTSVVVGPDGALYVTSLPGFPEAPGSAGIFRIDPSTGQVTRWLDGLTSAVDLTFDHHGDAYVAEIFGGAFGAGAIKKVDTGWSHGRLTAGTVSTILEADPTSPTNLLTLPSRVAVADDGTLYTTANIFGIGDVLKITQ
jgi:hypothetical protein